MWAEYTIGTCTDTLDELDAVCPATRELATRHGLCNNAIMADLTGTLDL